MSILVILCLVSGFVLFQGLMNIRANAGEVKNPCGFISSQVKSETEEKYYINPREISHLKAVYDNTAVGTKGKYVLGVIMTNGDVIHYGTYTSYNGRSNVIFYITDKVIRCNE